MAQLDDWTQIPTSLLDLADKTQEAEQWASAQRAQLAETWANAQRQVLGAMANTWQQGTAALDNFRQGYQAPSYNDMAGASSDFTPAQPQGLAALDQATSPPGPTDGTPLSQVPGNIANWAADNRAAAYAPVDLYAKQALNGGPDLTAEQQQAAGQGLANIGLGVGGLDTEAAGALGNIIGPTGLEQAPNLLRQLLGGATPDLGNVASGIIGQNGDIARLATLQDTLAKNAQEIQSVGKGFLDPEREQQIVSEIRQIQEDQAYRASPGRYTYPVSDRGRGASSATAGALDNGPLATRYLYDPNTGRVSVTSGRNTTFTSLTQLAQNFGQDFADRVANSRLGLMDEAQAAKRTVTASEVARPGAIGTEGIQLGQPTPQAPLSPAAKLGRQALIGAGQGAIGGGIAASQEPGATPGSVALGALEGAPGGAASALLREGLPAGAGARVGNVLSQVASDTGQAASQEGFAGNIRLEKLPEGVRDIVTDAYNQAPATFEAARRGVIPDAQVQQLADQVGSSVDKIVKNWQPGQAKNAETLLALRNALAAKAQDVATLKDAAASASATPADLLKFQAALRDQVALQQTVAGTTAEAGRALRQFRQTVSGAIASGDTQKITDVLNRYGGVEWTKDLAGKLAQLDTSDPIASYQFMRDALKPDLKNDVFGTWYNALLSNPHTLAVKTMSELTSLALSPIERGFAAAAEAPLSALQGRPRERFFGEIQPDIVGMANGIPEGVSKALFMIRNGFSLTDALAGSDFMHREAFTRYPLVSSIVNQPSRWLRAGVEMFGSMAQAGALNAGAYRLARLEGKTGDAIAQRMAELRANPTPALLKYAQDQGAYRVYQQKPGAIMQKFLALRNTDFHGVPVLRIIVPFAQTPANLLKFGLERSPLALFNVDAWKNIAANNPAAADNIGRWVMGSSIGAALTMYAGAGNITGLAPTNPTDKLAWEREGKQPNSIKLGNTWVNVSKVPALADTLLQVATIADGIRQGQDVSGIAGRLAATIGTNLSNQPYLTGVSTLMQALHDPAAYGQQFVNSLAASAVPSLSRAVAQTVDPTQRQTTNPLEAMQAEVPGLSQQLPAKIGAFGEERPREASVFSPLPTTQSHISPVDAELTKYGVEPGVSGKTLRGLDLTRQEQADYQRLSGQNVKNLLDQIIRDPRYQQADDPTKARILQRAITLAKDQAAQTYIRQLAQQQGQTTILQRIQQKKLQRLPAA